MLGVQVGASSKAKSICIDNGGNKQMDGVWSIWEEIWEKVNGNYLYYFHKIMKKILLKLSLSNQVPSTLHCLWCTEASFP